MVSLLGSMHNCYSELTNLENPFTAEDLFVDEDWDLFENYQIGKMNYHAGSIRWFDGHLDVSTIDPVYNAVKDNTSQFSGVGWITDKKVMKTMKEFANDCLPDNFIKGMWHTPTGQRLFPVTVLAWDKSSDWHMEGCRWDWQRQVFFRDIRSTTVCNFKMLGQDDTSSIDYAEPSKKMIDTLERLTKEFVEYEGGIEHDGVVKGQKMTFKPRTEEQGLMVCGQNDVISPPGEDIWLKELTPICTKTGYANPFLMNLEQWHKVNSGSNNSSRVTLRFMADKDIPFSHWEEMVDNGTFLK